MTAIQESADTAPEYQEPYDSGSLHSPDDFGDSSLENKTPPIVHKRDVDYSMYTPKEAQRIERAFLRKNSNATGNEFMTVMTPDNGVLITLEGTRGGVNVGLNAEYKKTVNNEKIKNLISLHTHPEDSPFSKPDLMDLCRNKSIGASIIEGIGSSYKMEILEGGSHDIRRFKLQYGIVEREVKAEMFLRPDQKVPVEKMPEFLYTINERMASRMGWKFIPPEGSRKENSMETQKNKSFFREFKTTEEINDFYDNELGSEYAPDAELPFDYEDVLACALSISDEEAEVFKKLSCEEQVEKDKEYQAIMATWSAEEFERRWKAVDAKRKSGK